MELIHILPASQSLEVKQPLEMYLLQELQEVAQRESGGAILQGIAAKSSYKILDNGCYELDASGQLQDVFSMADRIKADEIILPDVMGDMEGTIDATLDALDFIYQQGYENEHYYMGVCQGRDWDDYLACAQFLAGFKTIDVIGIPKKFCRAAVGNVKIAALMRSEFAFQLAHEDFMQDKKIHLLGVAWSPLELQKVEKVIRSCDTNLITENIKKGVPPISSWATFGELYSLRKELTDEQLKLLRMIIKDGVYSGR